VATSFADTPYRYLQWSTLGLKPSHTLSEVDHWGQRLPAALGGRRIIAGAFGSSGMEPQKVAKATRPRAAQPVNFLNRTGIEQQRQHKSQLARTDNWNFGASISLMSDPEAGFPSNKDANWWSGNRNRRYRYEDTHFRCFQANYQRVS